MFMNAGWLGGMVFALTVVLTCLFGARFAVRRSAMQPVFLVAYAAFVGHALEGFVIDLDHWRHFHVLMALCWGMMLSEPVPALSSAMARAFRAPRELRPHIAS